MLPGEPLGSVVGGEFGRTKEGDGCAVLFGNFCDLGVVGGDDDFGDLRHAEGEGDGVGDEGFPGEGADVFAGDALGATAGEDEGVGDGHGSWLMLVEGKGDRLLDSFSPRPANKVWAE